MRILVFGKNGQVARSLADCAHGSKHNLTFAGREDADLLKPGAGAKAISHHAPQLVINAAAYTAVDYAESEPEIADRLNHRAVGELAKSAAETGAQFIHISTDYVFDGAAAGLLSESSPTNPLGVYGKTKLAGEEAALAACPSSVILRTSWVFSEYGGNFVKTMLHLAETRNQLSIVADQIGGPTAAGDIAKTILEIASQLEADKASKGGVYHYQGAPTVSWADFAEMIFKIAGKPVAIERIPAADYPTPAKRPLETRLDCSKIETVFGVKQPDWQRSLEQVISALPGFGAPGDLA